MLIQDCKLDPQQLGVLAECLTGDPQDGEWPGQFLSAQTVAYSCGILARQQDVVVHAHDAEELKRCRRLAQEAAQIMKGVYIGGSDEGDHTLDPFCIPASLLPERPAPTELTEATFRTALRGTIYPKAVMTVEPFARSSAWWKDVSKAHADSADDPDELARLAAWGRLFDWFGAQKELHGPVCIGFKESGDDFASVYPKFFVGLTAAGSVVGLATCVVWT